MNALHVFRKELIDALRDRRSWMVALVISICSGPVVFSLMSALISDIEARAAERKVLMVAPDRAPTLVNFLLRAGARVEQAPADHETAQRAGTLLNAVVVPPTDFETRLATGEPVDVELVYDDSHDRARPLFSVTRRLLNGFNEEQGQLRLLMRGVSPQVLTPVRVESRNLAPAQANGAQLLFVVPWVALLVAVFGALSVAIDVTAGERERGSLEPLLMNPVSSRELALGKWAVVMTYSVVIVALTMAGFLLSMRLISSETLSALMQLQWREVAIFSAVLLPFTAMMAAINMLAATFGRSFKEAQTYVSYISMAVQFAALIPVFLSVRDALWQLLVPAVAQIAVMMKALRGESLSAIDLIVPGLCCLLVMLACLEVQARLLQREKIVFGQS
jgi:sodium transport system permease protein